jgi:hypothetical protein
LGWTGIFGGEEWPYCGSVVHVERESSEVNCEARVSRVSGVAVVCGVLSMSAWRAVWLVD